MGRWGVLTGLLVVVGCAEAQNQPEQPAEQQRPAQQQPAERQATQQEPVQQQPIQQEPAAPAPTRAARPPAVELDTSLFVEGNSLCVHLKNGREMEGTFGSWNGEELILVIPAGHLRLRAGQIVRVEARNRSPARSQQPADVTTPGQDRPTAPMPARVRAGQRYQLRSEDVTITYEVLQVVAGKVTYRRITTSNWHEGQQEVGQRSEGEWEPPPVALMGKRIGREKLVLAGVTFDCLIFQREFEERWWIAADPRTDELVFPGLVKAVAPHSPPSNMELVSVEDR